MSLRLFKPFLLACLLLFAQQVGWAHAADHLGAQRVPLEKQLPHSQVCDQCLAHASVAAGAPAWPPSVAVFEGAPVRMAAGAPVFSPRRHTPARSRAPPSSR